MKKLFFLSLACMMVLTGMGRAQSIRAMFSYSTFWIAGENKPYVETYLSFDAWTMHFEELPSGALQARAEVMVVARQGESISFAKRYEVASPTVGSLDEVDFSFIDMQRFSLPNGIYDLEISVKDKHVDSAASRLTEKLIVAYDAQRPQLSSVQLMSAATPTLNENVFSRGGYDMEPYVSDFFPEQVEEMHYYYEIYNIEREVGLEAFLTVAYIEERATGTRFSGVQNVVRRESASTVPVYGTLDLSALPSGSYNLVVEVRNRDNQLLLYGRLPFFRSNPSVEGGSDISDFATTFMGKYTDENELNLYLESLYPIASNQERSVAMGLIERRGIEEKQAFLYHFWQKRSAFDPEGEWLKYKERVDYVQATFSYMNTKGINTDRGRVYLQYGPPDFVRDEKNYVSVKYLHTTHTSLANTMQQEGNAESDMFAKQAQGQIFYLPYQLWRYNKLATDDPNRVFLFWDEHRSGLYRLLNSNARGEVQETGWERRLCRNQLPEDVVGEVGEQFNRGY